MQDLLVYAIVAGAAFNLWRLWRRSSQSGGCASGCGKCAEKPKAAPQLVQIQVKKRN